MNTDINFMQIALEEAKKNIAEDEVPVGAIIVKDNKIIAYGRNTRETDNNALGHAEINAIYNACKALNSWRLIGCTLYVTLEPCPMCAGAIINARIDRVVYSASDIKAGSAGSVINLFALQYNHNPKITKGILEDESKQILQDFFANRRKINKSEK